MPKDLVQRVLEEVAKTGFPLELRVADQLRVRGYHVATNVYFVDRDEGKGREIDIRALGNAFFTTGKLRCAVRHCLLIECKKSASRPWVFFSSPTVSYDQQVSDIASHGVARGWIRSSEEFWRFGRQHPWFRAPNRGRSFFEAFAGTQEANQNIQRAILGAVKATIDTRDARFAAGYPFPNATFYYPIVVLDGHLFAAQVRRGRTTITRASKVLVSVRYRSAQYTGNERHTVLVVTKPAFAGVLRALDRWLRTCALHFKRNGQCFGPVRRPRKSRVRVTRAAPNKRLQRPRTAKARRRGPRP